MANLSRSKKPKSQTPAPVSTGIPGLDEILGGGFAAHRVHLLEGDPGTGKTTLSLQFLLDGVARGESCLYVALSETADELHEVSRSHGWSIDGIHIFELAPSEGQLNPDEQYTLFHPSEVELSDTMKTLVDHATRLNPSRVVVDSLAEMRLLAAEPLRYRRQILALKQFFAGRNTTVLLIDDRSAHRGDLQVQSIAHGVLRLEQRVADYGAERRRLQVMKLRGVKYKGGFHDFHIEKGGIRVFPRMVAAEHRRQLDAEAVTSGITELDKLLAGGLTTGTTTAIVGPAGAGKTVLSTHYAAAAAKGGVPAAIYLFDERLNTLMYRSRAIGVNLDDLVDRKLISIDQLDPSQVSPGEFATMIRKRVDAGARVVVIDSLNGYLEAMQNESAVLVQLHELLTYLNQQGVLTILIVAQHGMLGVGMSAPIDVSYLADTLILIRFFEAQGAVRQAISVLKKRTGNHEHTIREFQITSQGPRVGEPLTNFQGVMTGVPQYMGGGARLLPAKHGRTGARRQPRSSRPHPRARR